MNLTEVATTGYVTDSDHLLPPIDTIGYLFALIIDVLISETGINIYGKDSNKRYNSFIYGRVSDKTKGSIFGASSNKKYLGNY